MAKKTKFISWDSGSKRSVRLSPKGIALAAAVVILCIIMMLFANVGRNAETLGSADIRLSEVVCDNRSSLVAADGSAPDWIEIENVGAETVNLKNYSLMYESAVGKLFVFPNVELGAGERMLVLADGVESAQRNGEYHAPFKLSSSGGDALCLMDASGSAIDYVLLPEVKKDQSYCRGEDGQWYLSAVPTAGKANEIAETAQDAAVTIETISGDVEISEVMSANTLYAADAQGLTYDYVELHNTGASAVDLSGWALSDDAASLGKWRFPSVSIPADGYLLVYCSGDQAGSDASQLYADFKISRSGESVYLSNTAGRWFPRCRCRRWKRIRHGRWWMANGLLCMSLPPVKPTIRKAQAWPSAAAAC